MTGDKVVDASALASVAFLEEEHVDIQTRLHGVRLHAPRLLRLEMVSICLKKLRKQPADRDVILRQFHDSFITPVTEHDVDYRELQQLAEQTKLTACDASYLWLSRHLNCELITLDDELDAVARAT